MLFFNGRSRGCKVLQIDKVMGHGNTEMVIKVYTCYVENARGTEDGSIPARVYQK
jgi:hypothetical protein